MTSWLDRMRLGLSAFREAFLTSEVVDVTDWSDQEARTLRYAINWAQYEQTSYRDVHKWATAYRKQFALYKYIRPIYNPAYRLGEFWKGHLFGGLLDSDAGEKGAMPIATENEALRVAIAHLWKWSRWQVQKDILTVRGTILGDAAVRVVDDTARERVYLDLLHPGHLQFVDRDPFGNVKGYAIRENRPDPRKAARTVVYTEIVSREGENVVYETFLNGEPYAWPDNVDQGQAVSRWTEPYGFVPLVVVQHNDVGLEWGWSELHPIRSKVQEVDDIAAQVSDHARRTVNPDWLASGMTKPATTPHLRGTTDTGADATTARPFPGREELKVLYAPTGAKMDALVAKLDLGNVLLHLDGILKEIERDMVELSQDIHTASGDASGRALRTARQPVITKVVQRRANYDAGMVAAQQMAIAIGGFRGYEGYEGFGLDSYDKGDLDHSIAARPVFEEDPLDKIEIDAAFWKAAEQAVKAGIPLEAYLREVGWEDERIAKLEIEEPEPVPDVLKPFALGGAEDDTDNGGDDDDEKD